MSDTSANQTEQNQIDALIQIKKDEISDLEDLKATFNDDYEPNLQTPAQVAQDSDAEDGARVAAANAVLGQDPAKVNEEQSLPSPSTHPEQFEDKSNTEATQEEQENAEAAAEPDDSVEAHEEQGVKLPDGREDVNKLGAQGQVEDAGDQNTDQAEKTVEVKDESKSNESKTDDKAKTASKSKKADSKKS